MVICTAICLKNIDVKKLLSPAAQLWGPGSIPFQSNGDFFGLQMSVGQHYIFPEYNQQDATFLSLFISVRRSTCFRRSFRLSSGAQNCTYSVRPILLPAASLARLAAGSSNGLTLYVQFWAPDDGRKDRLKHVERLTEINNLRNLASCWLYSAIILAMHGPMNVYLNVQYYGVHRQYPSAIAPYSSFYRRLNMMAPMDTL